MNKIDDALGLTPMVPEDFKQPAPLIDNQPQAELGQNMVDTDYDFARTNMRDAIAIAMQALQDAAVVASQSQQANSFVSVAQIATSVTNASKTLMDLSKTHKELKGDFAPQTQVTNQNLYVGTTSDFIKMLKERKAETNE